MPSACLSLTHAQTTALCYPNMRKATPMETAKVHKPTANTADSVPLKYITTKNLVKRKGCANNIGLICPKCDIALISMTMCTPYCPKITWNRSINLSPQLVHQANRLL